MRRGVWFWGGNGVRAGKFVGKNCNGDTPVFGAAFGGGIIGDGAILAIADRAHNSRALFAAVHRVSPDGLRVRCRSANPESKVIFL